MEKHPVRFTPEQIEFIQHLMQSGIVWDCWEYACCDIEETIIEAEHGIEDKDNSYLGWLFQPGGH